MEDFNDIIFETLASFGDFFHLRLVAPNFYNTLLSLHNEHADNMEMTQFIKDWDHSTETYKYMGYLLSDKSDEKDNSLQLIDDNLSFDILDDNTAMITISSFSHPFIEAKDKLNEYYRKASDYKNLIIDISKNRGGSDYYWMYGIVAPNINNETSYTHNFLTKSGKENMQYFDSLGIKVTNDMTSVAKLPKINQTDLKDFDTFFTYTSSIEPETGQKAFKGNIYVLIDKPVYSSSESFTLFCKKTGFATLVGRNSTGDGGGYSPILISLPESGLIFQFTTLYSINDDGSSNQEFGTTPDFLATDDETPLEAALRVIKQQSGIDNNQ